MQSFFVTFETVFAALQSKNAEPIIFRYTEAKTEGFKGDERS